MIKQNCLRAAVPAWTRCIPIVGAALLALAAGVPLAAQAQARWQAPFEQDRPIMLFVGGSVVWDSNIFRVPDSLARSEQITTAYVGLSLQKRYAQQQFSLRVTQGTQKYKNFSYLDFDPLDFDGAWRWYLTPRVSGSLTYAQTQYLNDFSDTRNFRQRNIHTSGIGAFTLDAQLTGGWHLLASIPYNRQTNSETFTTEQSYRETGITPGIRYIWPSGNSMTFNQTLLRGKFVDQNLDPVNQLDTGYRQSVSEFLTVWQVTGKSSITGRLGWLNRDYDNFSDRNFSGFVGRLAYTWRPTAKLSLSADAGRDLGSYQTDCSSYRVTDSVTLGSTWYATAKTSLQASLNYRPSDYPGPLPGCPLAERRDKSHGAQIGANWKPLRNALIGARVAFERKTSNFPGQNYDDTIGEVNASLSF